MRVPSACCSLSALALSVLSLAAQHAEEPPFEVGSETLVVLPDTEGYTSGNPETFQAMMRWIAEVRGKRSITGLLHVGDITNNNTAREWAVARSAFDLIEGQIPYVLAAGNHDYDNTPGRLTYLNEHFEVEDLRNSPAFGDVHEDGKLENHYQFLTIHDARWLVLSLEMGPRQGVIEWANRVLADHLDHPAIILTHGYLYYDNQRYNHLLGKQRASPYNFYGEGSDGEQLWNALVRRHPNVMMVVCGHLSSGYVGYRADEGDYGNIVHQMMVDYEKLKGGGQGFLRLLEFLPDKRTVQVRTFSPVTGGTNPRDPALEEFRFELQPATREEPRRLARTTPEPLRKTPIHRYSFDGEPGERLLRDTAGKRPGRLLEHAKLNGEGQLVLAADGSAKLPPRLLEGHQDFTFELWFAPTSESYRWSAPIRLGNTDDWFTYVFRTFDTHRAEIAVDRFNEDIQQSVPTEVNKTMHVVVSYQHDGRDGKPLLSYYRDGDLRGQLPTRLALADVIDEDNRLGPFAGRFDELRFYDRTLTPGEVAHNFNHGPDELVVAEGEPSE